MQAGGKVRADRGPLIFIKKTSVNPGSSFILEGVHPGDLARKTSSRITSERLKSGRVKERKIYRLAEIQLIQKALQTPEGTLEFSEMSNQLLSGHKYEELKGEKAKALGLDIFNHGLFRSDDVMVMTFPKCGTTWMQEIVWTMLHNPNLDNSEADEFLWIRSEDLSLDMMFDVMTLKGQPTKYYMKKFNETCPGKNWEEGLSLHLAEAAKSPRVFKSHFPLSLYPDDILDKIKVVYVTRNPRDMIVSYSYFFEALKVYPISPTIDESLKALIAGRTLFSPYWPHVKQAWQKRHHPNLHFVFYEDMKADIMLELRKLNEFLGTQLNERKLEAIGQYTSFSSMKSRGEPVQDDYFDKENENDVKFFRKAMRKRLKTVSQRRRVDETKSFQFHLIY
ncbi:Sulfotransferase 1C4 [Portunus trituberculatus]|uniref:Sulfotransferase 1C4 n=1 Tax=Portunus trituberculatus TaxID=210409 RepID=A0A5B7DN56_PORTR|nr:Sulfotransferase 1C4 [Portunus trituberculatus]